jgi:O-succinylbenzoate synthase
MKLARLDVYRYRLPLAVPLALPAEVLHERAGLLVRLSTATGVFGWGDVAPLSGFSRETVDEAGRQLESARPLLVGRSFDPADLDPHGGLAAVLDDFDVAPSVRFGLELALTHLSAALRGQTLARALWERPRPVVHLNGLLTGTPSEVLARAEGLRAAGYVAAKLKVGRRPVEEDIRLTRAVAERLGPGVALRLDANRAWSLEEACAFAEGVRGWPIAYVEEPTSNPAHLDDLMRACTLPVALDETLTESPRLDLAWYPAIKAVVLKPTLLGGLSRVFALAKQAGERGIVPVLSAAFETGVGLRALVALAAGMEPEGTAMGLDTYRWFAADVLRPRLRLEVPVVSVARATRLSRDLDPDRLEPAEWSRRTGA